MVLSMGQVSLTLHVCLSYYLIAYTYELKVGWNLKIFSFNSGHSLLTVPVVYGYKVIHVNNVVNTSLGTDLSVIFQ